MLEKYFRIRAIESKNYTKIGNYWDRKGEVEIDYIALNELKKEMSVAEVKRNKSKIDLNKLQQKMIITLNNYSKYSGYQIDYMSLSLDDM